MKIPSIKDKNTEISYETKKLKQPQQISEFGNMFRQETYYNFNCRQATVSVKTW